MKTAPRQSLRPLTRAKQAANATHYVKVDKAAYLKLIDLKAMVLTHGKALDEAHKVKKVKRTRISAKPAPDGVEVSCAEYARLTKLAKLASILIQLVRDFRSNVDVSRINNSRRSVATWEALIDRHDALMVDPQALVLENSIKQDAQLDALLEQVSESPSNDTEVEMLNSLLSDAWSRLSKADKVAVLAANPFKETTY